MAYNTVTSSGNGRRNDDLVRIARHAGVIDLLLLDGATSLAERDYVDAAAGDPAWFVGRFADALARACAGGAPDDQEAAVQAALAEVRAAWHAGGGAAAPLYAWPIAALSWIRVRADGDAHLLQLYCLGDCKLLLGGRDGAVRDLDPYDNPSEHALGRAVAALVADGVLDAAQRFAALTPALRARREAQQLGAPAVLCLAPRGRFAARTRELRVAGGALLLAMTDGFYRLVDPYALMDDAGLLRACETEGLEAVLAGLRRHEAARDTARLSVKGADDATAVALALAPRAAAAA